MKCNMGTMDRYIRASMGIAFAIYAAMTLKPIFAIPVLIIAYTVSTRWCLLYQMMGINTGCHLEEKDTKGTRNNIIEGLSISLVFLLLLLIIYLIVRYINI